MVPAAMLVKGALALGQVGMNAVQLMEQRNIERDLRKQTDALKREAFQYLDSLVNPFAAFQASDTKERLAMDQQAQNVANALEVMGVNLKYF